MIDTPVLADPARESRQPATPLGDTCFLKTQFPVAKMSAESYKERKANYSQTLTGLGKWWGRKPLVLCRATILGLLLPATSDPRRDREVFLRLMTMDEDGLMRRKSKAIPPARLVPDRENRRYGIEIVSRVGDAEMKAAKKGTVRGGYVVHPVLEEKGKQPASIAQIRIAGRGRDPKARYHDGGLRLWENDDLVPRPDDVFEERLYCVRWVRAVERRRGKGASFWDTEKEYRAPTPHDLAREERALDPLRERFHEWQREGFLPSMRIEPGDKSRAPEDHFSVAARTRGTPTRSAPAIPSPARRVGAGLVPAQRGRAGGCGTGTHKGSSCGRPVCGSRRPGAWRRRHSRL